MEAKSNTIAKLKSIYPVSRETSLRLECLVQSVERWQTKTNLVSGSTLDEIWTRHVADSLQLLALKPDANRWLDLGSGGGFPGLVIAAVMTGRIGSKVDLVESNTKKAAFLRNTSRQMGAEVMVHAERIEAVADHIPVPEIVTARALTAMPRLIELAYPWLSKGAVGLFHKGRGYEQELEECNGVWEFDLVKHQSAVEDDSVVLEITNVKCVS